MEIDHQTKEGMHSVTISPIVPNSTPQTSSVDPGKLQITKAQTGPVCYHTSIAGILDRRAGVREKKTLYILSCDSS